MNWYWLIGAVGVAIMANLLRIRAPRNVKFLLGAGLVVLAVVKLGLFTGAGTVGGGLLPLHDMKVSAGAVGAETGADVITNNDHNMAIYVADADVADNQYINYTLTLERTAELDDAGGAEVECFYNTEFVSGSTTYNLVSLDADNQVEVTIDGSGTQTANSVSKIVEFSAGSASATAVVQVKQDETGHDAMTTKQSLSSYCSAGGQTVNVQFIENG